MGPHRLLLCRCAAQFARSATAFVLLGCGTPSSAPAYATQSWPEEEDREIERAKRHPIATPAARSQYPQQAPPPGAASAAPAAEQSTPSAAALADRDGAAVVDEAPPPARVENVPPAPAPDWTWAPGYWHWSAPGYVWIAGVWLAPNPGFAFIAPRWTYHAHRWVFVPGGWARRGSAVIVYPAHRPPPPLHRARRPESRHYVAPPARPHTAPRRAPPARDPDRARNRR